MHLSLFVNILLLFYLLFLRNKRLEIIDEAFWEFATNIPLDYKKALK